MVMVNGDGDGDGDGDADDDDADGDDGADGADDVDDDAYDGYYDGCRMHEHTHFFLMRIAAWMQTSAAVQDTQQAMLQSSGFELVDSQELLIRFCIGSLGIVINQP